VSDQDFFFDEDEQTEKAAPQDAPAKKASAPKSSAKAPASDAPGAQSVTVTIAALIGVIGLLAGLVVGLLLPFGNTGAVEPTATGASPAGTTAPQLSPEQMQGGELPAGHPDIGAMQGGEASGSAETTSK